ncbi:ATP-dependent zinc metalloprotease FtsH [Vulgatibacter sp.]|uniref:ATP-dependent zinc metalloprotease FtsH n=1 Tax=Vulgatibacter sp. TaxID=1971226 RepID=UPI0035628AD1
MATKPAQTPRGGGGNKKQPNPPGPETPKFRFGSPLGIILLLIAGFFLFRGFFENIGVTRVPYSEFVNAVEGERFHRVVIGEGWVKGYLTADAMGQPPPAGAEEPIVGGDAGSLPWMANLVPGTEDRLVETLQDQGIEYEAVRSSNFGELMLIWMVPILLALLFWSWMMRRVGSQMGQGPPGVMTFGKTRAKLHMENDTGVGFKDVAGIEEAVEELKEIVDFLKSPEKFRRLGGKIPKGVMLVGPPGTGKTLLARAVAGEAGVPFFSLSGSEFVEMFVGVGAARVRDLFQQAQGKAPCIIFIDELDAIGKSRNSGIMGHDEREQTLNQLLAEMDGFDSRVGLIIIAATNRPEILDPALMRPGRFDRQVLVDRPDKKGREKILEIHAKEVKLARDVDLRNLAARTPGFVGADLANIMNEGALLAARRGKDEVTRSELEEAIERVVAGLEKKSRRINEREKEIVAYHESGHTIVGWMLPRTERVQKVSIIPRGVAALGYTMQMPLEDRYLMTLPELQDKIAALLGGRVAEELIVGEISTGAANDLQQATDIAAAMVREYGMSEAVGPVALGDRQRAVFLQQRGQGAGELRGHSEHLHRIVDAEIQRIVEQGLETARQVVRTHREKLEQVAARLLQQEVVEEEELERILGPKAGYHPRDEHREVVSPAPAPTAMMSAEATQVGEEKN